MSSNNKLTQRGPNATTPARLPGIQTARIQDANVRQAVESLREWVEVRLGSRGDIWERAITKREYKLDYDDLRFKIDNLEELVLRLQADAKAGSGVTQQAGVPLADFEAFKAFVYGELDAVRALAGASSVGTGDSAVIIRTAAGSSSGVASGSGIGASTVAVPGASSGVAVVTAVGLGLSVSSASATGVATATAVSGNDANWTSVSLLLHMNGANNSTSFPDTSSSPKTVTANGDAKITTSTSVFGGASATFDGTGDFLSIPSDSSLSLNSSTFCVEGRAKLDATTGNRTLVDFRGSGASNSSWLIYADAANRSLHVYNGVTGTTVASTGGFDLPASGTWFAWSVCHNGSSTVQIHINGNTRASAGFASVPATDSSGLRIGMNQAGADGWLGQMDELRITKGASRYFDTNYTPASAAFPDG